MCDVYSTYLYKSWVQVNPMQCEEVVPVSNDGSHVLRSSRSKVRELGNFGQTLTCVVDEAVALSLKEDSMRTHPRRPPPS